MMISSNSEIYPPMAISLPSPDRAEEYIDMELGSFFLQGSLSQHQREFEFNMSTASLWREATTSPADELFYKGKLLPLQLPPRIEMVEKLLRNSVSAYEESYATPLMTTAPTSPTASTPFESCNISPCDACGISRELNPDVYLCEFLVDLDTVKPMGDNPKMSWWGNIKLMKQHLFGPNLKGSRAFFKSLLGKFGCTHDLSAAATTGFMAASSHKRDGSLNRNGNPQKGDISRQAQLNKGPVKASPKESAAVAEVISFHQRRRPLPLSSKWLTSNKISSSSFSSSLSASSSSLSAFSSKEQDHSNESESRNSSRSTYVNSESPIQAAIAYCKQSQNPPQEPDKQPDIFRG